MTHPVLAAAASLRAVLKDVGDSNPTFMTTADKAAALQELTRAQSQLTELQLRILADAGDVAETTAAQDAAAWLTHHARVRFEDARADLALAKALDRRYAGVATALRQGEATVAQARVIVRALDSLPDEVAADILARAEEILLSHVDEFGPRELGRLGRRILDVAAPEIAEEAEARHLAELEAEGRRKTRLRMRRLGDGTTRISGLLPDVAATRLATYLEAFTNPRKDLDTTPDPDVAGRDPFTRLAYPRRLGEAFCQFLETVDATRLPIHAGDATTVVVTISLDALRKELATAELLAAGQVPGDELTGQHLTATQVRRLACSAHLIPAVLGGDGQPLDLGRARRLFSPAQHKAMLLRDRTCRAEGCQQPGRWCEAHHLDPWSRGGSTDLDRAVLLCRHHHQRIHDTAFHHERLPSGDLRFHRRT